MVSSPLSPQNEGVVVRDIDELVLLKALPGPFGLKGKLFAFLLGLGDGNEVGTYPRASLIPLVMPACIGKAKMERKKAKYHLTRETV
jgi:hypothetical protein